MAEIIITIASTITAISVIVSLVVTLIHWIDRQNNQDKQIKAIKDEQRIIVSGLLACLQGLKEQGCNGPVTKGIEDINKYLNEEVHK